MSYAGRMSSGNALAFACPSPARYLSQRRGGEGGESKGAFWPVILSCSGSIFMQTEDLTGSTM